LDDDEYYNEEDEKLMELKEEAEGWNWTDSKDDEEVRVRVRVTDYWHESLQQ
jgi:hypothetical protein